MQNFTYNSSKTSKGVSLMFANEKYAATVIEILRILYFSDGIQSSSHIRSQLGERGFDLDSRTVRYHLSNMESENLVKRKGNRGAYLTEKGISEAKMLFVFDRVGTPSFETEKLSSFYSFNGEKKKGFIVANCLLLEKNKLSIALQELKKAAFTNVWVSSLLGISKEPEKLWKCDLPDKYVGLVCVSSRNYDVALQKKGIYVETSATGLYSLKNFTPRGFTEIISHTGTTLSPGEILIRGRYTSVCRLAETGEGLVTAAIKTFPSFLYKELQEALAHLDPSIFSGLIFHGGLIPPSYRISSKDRNKGYMVIYGGANLFSPLIEKGIATNLSIASSLYDVEQMTDINNL